LDWVRVLEYSSWSQVTIFSIELHKLSTAMPLNDIQMSHLAKPNPSDPDFFHKEHPGASVVIYQDESGFYAQAKRGSHKGPILLRSPQVRGMLGALLKLGWSKEAIDLRAPIPLEQLPPIEEGGVPARLQKYPALAIRSFQRRFCAALKHQEPEDQEPVIQAFKKAWRSVRGNDDVDYYGVDSVVERMQPSRMVEQFSVTDLCRIRHSALYTKNDEFVLAMHSEVAPLIVERIRLSGWHNSTSTFSWDEMAQIYNQLRTFSMGLPGFSVSFDHTTGCNPKGYSSYFYDPDNAERPRIYIDGELAFLINFKGKPVMVVSFNVSKPSRNAAPAIYIRQVQLLAKTGNRWLFKLPCPYMEHVIIRMREAFHKNDLYLIRGDILGEEIIQNYLRTLKRTVAHLKTGHYFTDNGRQTGENEARQLRSKIKVLRTEVMARLRRNYATPSRQMHRFIRHRRGDYWKLEFRPGKENLQQDNAILLAE
jgi:hypothetical protein